MPRRCRRPWPSRRSPPRATMPGVQPPAAARALAMWALLFGDFGHHDMCRTHAEQRAIMLAREGDGWRLLPGAKLVYVRLEADGSVRLEKPHFCPRCSRLALSLGVAEWIFALSEGLVGYSAADYDVISQLGWLAP